MLGFLNSQLPKNWERYKMDVLPVYNQKRGEKSVCLCILKRNGFVDNASTAKAYLFSQNVSFFKLQWKLNHAFGEFLFLQNTQQTMQCAKRSS